MSERYSDNPAFGAEGETNNASTAKPNSTGEAADKVADNIKYGDQAAAYASAHEANASGEAAGEDDVAGGYEPSDFTVDEVNKHIADHPDEADDILERERDGKARVTILGDE